MNDALIARIEKLEVEVSELRAGKRPAMAPDLARALDGVLRERGDAALASLQHDLRLSLAREALAA